MPQPSPLSAEPLVIATSLSEAQNARLEAHPARPRVLRITVPWDIPEPATVLMTYQTQWRYAPATAPAGWPHGLRWAQVASAGLDTFPAWFRAVPIVSRGRGVQAPAIAEYVIGAIFAHEKQFWDVRARSVEQWRHRTLGAVAGKVLGIVGLGAIGEEVARLAGRLGLDVAAFTRSAGAEIPGVRSIADLDRLMAIADHLVLAVPLTDQTRRMVDRRLLAQAKPGLHLINVARGAIVDDAALIEALDGGRVAAATLDVTDPEPLPAGHPFYDHPRIRLTPHVCGMSEDHEERLSACLLGNLDRYLAGEPPLGLVPSER